MPSRLLSLALALLLALSAALARAQDLPLSHQSKENPEAPADSTEQDWQPWRGGRGIEFTLGQMLYFYELADLARLHRNAGLDPLPTTTSVLMMGLAGEVGQGWRVRLDFMLSYDDPQVNASITTTHYQYGGSLVVLKRLNREGRGPLDIYLGAGLDFWDLRVNYRRFTRLPPPSIEQIWGVSEPDALTNRASYLGLSPQLTLSLRRVPLSLTVGYSSSWAVRGPRLEWGDRINITDDAPNGEPEFVQSASIGAPRRLGMAFVALHFRLHVSD